MTHCHACHSPTERSEALNGYDLTRFWYDACTNETCPWSSARTHYEHQFGKLEEPVRMRSWNPRKERWPEPPFVAECRELASPRCND